MIHAQAIQMTVGYLNGRPYGFTPHLSVVLFSKCDFRPYKDSRRIAAHGSGIKPDPTPRYLQRLPTQLTAFRIVLVPALFAAYVIPGTPPAVAAAIFTVASVTDWADGALARRLNAQSKLGAFLDPVADKLLVAVALVLLCTAPPLPILGLFGSVAVAIPAATIISREIWVSALREWAAQSSPTALQAVAVSSLGKWKTATQMVSIIAMLVARDTEAGWATVAAVGGLGFMYISAILGCWSGIAYFRAAQHSFK